MTANEKIARWLGKRIYEYEDRLMAGQGEFFWQNAMTVIKKRADYDDSIHVVSWAPDEDISCWHGEDGLFAEILQQKLWSRFLVRLLGFNEDAPATLSWQCAWVILTSSPAQLAAALVEVIEG